MTAQMAALIDGEYVPLADCDWVLFGACGCPFGVCTAFHHPTEDQAWKSFYDYKREIIAAQRRGNRLELVAHKRWSAELLGRHMAGCTHGILI